MDFETVMVRSGECSRQEAHSSDSCGCPQRECGCERRQKHVHEITGSTQIAGCCDEAHNHRFATVSDEAIPIGNGDHAHEVCFRTDSADGHYHEFKGRTSGAIHVGGGRHVHFIEAKTEEADGHKHCFRAATLIDSPIDRK